MESVIDNSTWNPLSRMVARCSSDLDNDSKESWLGLLIDAHMRAAHFNDNLSKGVFNACVPGNGSFAQSAAAAILSIGHLHAPVWQARQVLFRNKKSGDRVPGFGNSFFKDKIDPAFADIFCILPPSVRDPLDSTYELLGHYPNAAAITAAVCELIGYPDGLESEIFIHARLAVWADCWKQPPTLLG